MALASGRYYQTDAAQIKIQKNISEKKLLLIKKKYFKAETNQSFENIWPWAAR